MSAAFFCDEARYTHIDPCHDKERCDHVDGHNELKQPHSLGSDLVRHKNPERNPYRIEQQGCGYDNQRVDKQYSFQYPAPSSLMIEYMLERTVLLLFSALISVIYFC
jgi:CO dehydrogenase/acetyl-CoA synthase beta subunit